MTDMLYYILSTVLIGVVLTGLILMSKVEKAKAGSFITGLAVLAGVLISLIYHDILDVWVMYIFVLFGTVIGLLIALRVKMIDMPQLIALLNSFGGLASAIVGGFALLNIGGDGSHFSLVTAIIALVIGAITFTGSIIAALKLHRVINQGKVLLKLHNFWVILAIVIIIGVTSLQFIIGFDMLIVLGVISVLSLFLGVALTLPIGGADMPIVISLLNSLSGVAGAISGLAIGDLLLVSIGGIVGASGLLLTQIMSHAMNRKIIDILFPKQSKSITTVIKEEKSKTVKQSDIDYLNVLKTAKEVIIVPGYGMAVAQAQHLVKELTTILKDFGANIRFAIHPVAGRMPGHMNVLLAEAHIDYDLMKEIDEVNDDFKNIDLTIVIGANDVVNPAARTAVDTPLYGMPILNVDECENIFIFNYDLKPGYSGVDNPLYEKEENVKLFLGNAFDTLGDLIKELKG